MTFNTSWTEQTAMLSRLTFFLTSLIPLTGSFIQNANMPG